MGDLMDERVLCNFLASQWEKDRMPTQQGGEEGLKEFLIIRTQFLYGTLSSKIYVQHFQIFTVILQRTISNLIFLDKINIFLSATVCPKFHFKLQSVLGKMTISRVQISISISISIIFMILLYLQSKKMQNKKSVNFLFLFS